MYEYTICNQPDKEIYEKQCMALEKRVPDILLVSALHDVDDSQKNIYSVNDKKVTVANDYYIGGVFVTSEIELEQFFL